MSTLQDYWKCTDLDMAKVATWIRTTAYFLWQHVSWSAWSMSVISEKASDKKQLHAVLKAKDVPFRSEKMTQNMYRADMKHAITVTKQCFYILCCTRKYHLLFPYFWNCILQNLQKRDSLLAGISDWGIKHSLWVLHLKTVGLNFLLIRTFHKKHFWIRALQIIREPTYFNHGNFFLLLYGKMLHSIQIKASRFCDNRLLLRLEPKTSSSGINLPVCISWSPIFGDTALEKFSCAI